MILAKLNTKAIKKALKNYGVTVLQCKKASGKNNIGTILVVSNSTSELALEFLHEFGVVDSFGRKHKYSKTNRDYYQFTNCFLSEEMYNEINL